LAASFGDAETSLLIIASGIHAAAEENSSQRIISAMDGGGSRQ